MEKERYDSRSAMTHNSFTTSADMPPLCQAAMNGNLEMVQYLLESGVDVNSKAKGGMTALMLAALFAHEAVVAKLLKYGANNEARNAGGFTARDMVDPKSMWNTNTPFYDLSSCKIRKVPQDENSFHSYTNLDNNHHRADKGESILKRRNKSLPKINIHECSSVVAGNQSGHSVRTHSANTRYSPYSRAMPKLNSNNIVTPTTICTPKVNQNLQNLSPNVAKFFGNALLVKSPCIIKSPIVVDHQIPYHITSSDKPIGSPVLRKFLSDHGFSSLIDLFEHQEINFKAFSTLTDVDLKQIGIRNAEQRMKLLALIRRIRQ